MASDTSRVFHLMMLIPAGLVLLLSLISLSSLATVNKEFRSEYDKLNPDGDAKCILYAESESDNDLDFSDGETCNFSIGGGGLLAAVAVVYAVILVVKAAMGISVFSALSLIELGLSGAATVWAFIVSVVITAGLDETCKAYAEAYKEYNFDKFPCCSYYIGPSISDEDNVFFYERVNTSRISAWLAMAVLLGLTVTYATFVIKYFLGGGGRGRSTSATTEKAMAPM